MKPKAVHKSIIFLIKKCWKTHKKSKRRNGSEEQIGYSLSKSEGKTHMGVCPIKTEIIGGPNDGKFVWKNYIFDIGEFVNDLNEIKIKIENIAMATKFKPSIECDQLLFVLNYKKEKICLSVLTRPADDLDARKRFTHSQENE